MAFTTYTIGKSYETRIAFITNKRAAAIRTSQNQAVIQSANKLIVVRHRETGENLTVAGLARYVWYGQRVYPRGVFVAPRVNVYGATKVVRTAGLR